jgi:hypothetical protein
MERVQKELTISPLGEAEVRRVVGLGELGYREGTFRPRMNPVTVTLSNICIRRR